MNDQICIGFDDNPQVRKAFEAKKVGDKCKLEIEVQIDSMDEMGVQASVLTMEPKDPAMKTDPGPEPEGDKYDNPEPDEDMPDGIQVIISAPKKRG